jgi:hypothetical protein
VGLDVSGAIPITDPAEFDAWLAEHGGDASDVVVAIYKKASGKQTVTAGDLLEQGIRHGWVDTQTKGIDHERYAIRFMPRRPGSHWTEGNRDIARRLLAEGRMTPRGVASLPYDL